MILRALRLVNVHGLPEVRVAGIPEHGVVRVALPQGATGDLLADALHFALTGEAEGVLPDAGDARGFAFVEVALRTGGGEDFSLFRGIDRKGAVQVSLREDAGRRVAGREDAVRERLADLFGTSAESWCRDALDVALPAPGEAGPAEAAPAPAGRSPDDDVAAAAGRAVQELRRALRAERLRLLASRRHAELLELGRRIRHERGIAALEVDRLGVERDRVRTRLRRVNEYRDQLARTGAPAESGPAVPAGASAAATGHAPAGGWHLVPESALQGALITCAGGLLLALVLYSTAATDDPDRGIVQAGLGIGLLISIASYLFASSREPAAPRGGAPGSGPESAAADRGRRDSLRQRFSDLGDPDDPGLPDSLRARLSELDAALSPLHTRLERLDDAIAVFDVEAGRAARALHESLPELTAGSSGLPEGTDAGAAVPHIHELGDAVYAAVVERDALLAEGAVDPAAARQALAAALDAVTARSGAPASGAGLLRKVDSFACAVGEDPEEDRLADLLDAEVRRIASAPAAAPDAAPRAPAAPRSGLVVPVAGGERLADAELLRHFGEETQVLVGEPGGGPGEAGVRRAGLARRPG